MVEVGKVRESYIERCKDIMEILESQSVPIKNTDLQKQLRQETKIKVSPSTLSKCLKRLVFTGWVNRIETKGRGNPVYYEANKAHDVHRSDLLIKHDRNLLMIPENLNDCGQFGFNFRHFGIICIHLSPLINTLIDELYTFSNSKKRRDANEIYRMYLETQLLPSLIDLLEIVKPPLKMSEETHAALINGFTLVLQNYVLQYQKGLTPEQAMGESNKYIKMLLKNKHLLQDLEKLPSKYNENH